MPSIESTNQNSPLQTLASLGPRQIAAKDSTALHRSLDGSGPADSAAASPAFPGKKGAPAAPAAQMSGYMAAGKDEEGKTKTDAQTIGQQDDYDDNAVVQEFLSYMQKSPAERYFDKLLKALGLTKEEYEALPPEEKAEVMKKIEAMKEEEARQRSEGLDPETL